jgi:hypothetical protein
MRVSELIDLEPQAVEERFAATIWPQLNDQLSIIRKLQAEAEAAAGPPANIANAFFLGHDLRWTMDVLSSGAPANDVKHGLVQILHQATDLGIGDENPVLALQQKVKEFLAVPDDAWTTEIRSDADLALRLAFERIGALIISLQQGYRPYDPENQARWLAMQADGRA